ncbi:Cullin protein neddylation domain-containing protein [Mycena rebaudengoi]|nr:Cullin protein neddylation domain-containing protein [Mycena rebaudengoi]
MCSSRLSYPSSHSSYTFSPAHPYRALRLSFSHALSTPFPSLVPPAFPLYLAPSLPFLSPSPPFPVPFSIIPPFLPLSPASRTTNANTTRRITKPRKTTKDQALIQEVIAQISQRFAPKIPDIKKVIETLLEKEYIERVDGSKDTFTYVA